MTEYKLGIGIESIAFLFKPVYNGTPTKLEWVIEYMVNYGLKASAWDMGCVRYAVYNNNTTTWDAFGEEGHFFVHANSTGEAYFGQLTIQLFMGEKSTNVSYYINDDGLVKCKMYWDYDSSDLESEIHDHKDTGEEQYISRDAAMKTNFNGLYIYT